METQNRFFSILNKIESYDCGYKQANFTSLPLSVGKLAQLEIAVSKTSIISNIIWDEKQILDENTRKIEKIISQSNNKGVYPTAYQYGLLSNASYQQNMLGKKVPVETSQEFYLQDWYVNYVLNDTESGYYGVIYQNNKTCNYVVVHRGIYLPKWYELFTKNSGIQYVLKDALQSKIGKQNLQAYLITKQAVELSKPNFYLSFTGHSSGGDLATLSGYYIIKESWSYYAKVVTFNSLGAVSVIEDLESNIITNKIDLHAMDVSHYMSMPDIFNSFHSHLGKIYRVFPQLDLTVYEDLKKKYLPDISNIEILEDNFVGYLTIFDNTLDMILKEFNPDTGLPRFFKEMSDWPCTTCDAKYKMSSTVEEITTKIVGSILGAATNKVLGAAQSIINYVIGEEKQFSNVKLPNFINEMLSDVLLRGRGIVLFTNLLYDIFSGKLKQSQYWEVFEKQVKYELKDDRSKLNDEKGRFDLIYTGHYQENDVDLNKMCISKDNNPLDLIIYLLRIQSVFLDNLNINEFLKKELKETASEYSLDTEWGQITIILNYDSNLNAIKVKEKIIKLSYTFPIARALLNIQHTPKLNTQELYFETKIPYLRDKNFIGREDVLESISESFLHQEYVLLRGIDGVGKTSVAIEFAYAYKSDGSLVRWFSGNSKVALDSGFKKFAEDLNFILVGNETPEKIKSNIYKKLYRVTQPILLIFDDVIDQNWIQFYLRELPDNIKVLITSTQKSLIDGKELVISTFSEEEAVDYVKTHIHLEINQIEQLINYVGRFPLKLKYAVAYLNDNEYLTIEEYIEEDRELKGQSDLMFEHVFSAFANMLKGDELKILSCLALLKYNVISLPFLKTYLSRSELKNLMLIGKKLSIFNITEDRKSLSIDIEIQQELFRYLKSKYGDELLLKVNDLAEKLGSMVPNLNSKSVREDHKTASLYIVHIQKLLEFEDLDLSIKTNLNLKFADYLIYHNRDYQTGITLYNDILQNTIERNTIILLYKKLADAHSYLNAYQEALKYYVLAENKLDLNDDIQIELFMSMAQLYLDMDKFDKSRQYYEKASKLSEALSMNKVVILTKLGELNFKLSKFGKGLKYLDKACAIYQNLSNGFETIELAEIFNMQGKIYHSQGKYNKSLQSFGDSLRVKEKLYGKTVPHPEKAKELNNIGNVYGEQGDYIKALKHQHAALDINQKAYVNISNWLTIMYESNIAATYFRMGNYNESQKRELEALNMKKEFFGDIHHEEIIRSFCSLGAINNLLNNVETSFQYFQKCLHMSEELYKDKHLNIVDALCGIGDINIKRGYIGDALDYYMRGCSMMEYLQISEYPYPQMQDTIKKYENYMHSDECTTAYFTISVFDSEPMCEIF